MERMKCHSYIKKYVRSKRANQYTVEKDKIPPGPFFVKNIPREIRLFGFKDDNVDGLKRDYNYNKNRRRSARLKDKAQGKKSNNSIFKIKCDHNPKCFINIGKM